VLLKWHETTYDTLNGPATKRELLPIDEFRSFVRPTWRPELHPFCTQLTGITQVRPHLHIQDGRECGRISLIVGNVNTRTTY